VFAAAKRAVDKARNGGGPTFIEAVTYRLGAHTTSDDPTRYREDQELAAMRSTDPIARFKEYLISTGRWTEEQDAEQATATLRQVKEAFAEAEAIPPVTARSLFDDVYSGPTRNLEKEAEQLAQELGED
jgi:TPP-dependent pyruvate/acetoin dehydrogenase alpha subunit